MEVPHWTEAQPPPDGGLELPPRIRVEAEDYDELDYDITLCAELEDSRYVITELTARRKPNGLPITPEGLRSVATARVLEMALSGHIRVWTRTEDGELRGHHAWTVEDELVRVAGTYRIAQACGIPPTKSVAEIFNITRSAAAKKVMAARKAGLLGPTTPGKKGETP